MDTINLNASKREATGKQVKKLRAEEKVPAVVYGHGVENQNVAVDYREMEKALNEAGESTLIDLKVGDAKPVKVLIHEVQYEPRLGTLVHVDFRQVKMDEKITTEIPVKFIGEAPAVKTMGGTLVRNLETLTVTCLPGDLVHEFDVNLDKLANIDDTITVGDIPVPAGLTIEHEPDQIIAIVTGVVSEEELAAMEAENAGGVGAVEAATDQAPEEAAEGAEEKK